MAPSSLVMISLQHASCEGINTHTGRESSTGGAVIVQHQTLIRGAYGSSLLPLHFLYPWPSRAPAFLLSDTSGPSISDERPFVKFSAPTTFYPTLPPYPVSCCVQFHIGTPPPSSNWLLIERHPLCKRLPPTKNLVRHAREINGQRKPWRLL